MAHPLRLVLCVLALLFGLSLDHGLPHRYVPDDTVVSCALGMARDAAEGEGLAGLVPPAGEYTTYPYLLPYLDLGVLGVRYVAGRALGEWGGAGEFAERVFEDPSVAWLPARVLSALLGLLLPYGVYRAARELGRAKGASALAALLAGSSLLVVQLAHTTRPWAPTLGFAAVALWASLRLQRRRRVRDVAFAFGAAACAGASFQVGLAYLGLPLGALLLPRAGSARDRGLGLVAGVLMATLVLGGLGYPYRLVHGASSGQGHQTGDSALLEGGADASLDIGGQAFSFEHFGGARLGEVTVSWLGYDPVLALLGVLGCLALLLGTLREQDERGSQALAVRLLVAVPGLGLTAAFLLYDGTHVRYLLSAVPFLALGAGALLARLAAAGGAGRVVAVGLLALPLVQAARLDQLLGREETRTLAARALPGLIGPEERAAVDGLGSLYGPPMVPRAETLAAFVEDQGARATSDAQRGFIWLNRREQRIQAAHEAGLPAPLEARHLLPLQRCWKYISYYPTDFLFGDGPVSLDEWLMDWDVDVYVRVDRAPRSEPRAPVDELTATRGDLVLELSPTGATDPAEAALPTDMDFALTALWKAERPGPWIRAYRLREGGP